MKETLELYSDYTRKEIHDFFEPDKPFVERSGRWGRFGIVELIDRKQGFVFFVTIKNNIKFDEGISKNGVLTWQSQHRHHLKSRIIEKFINHDYSKDNIFLFLKSRSDRGYFYLGKLAYLSHDPERERPVHFKWQILDWNPNEVLIKKMGLKFPQIESVEKYSSSNIFEDELNLIRTQPPSKTILMQDLETPKTKGLKVDFEESEINRKLIGDAGELQVLKYEKEVLQRMGHLELAEKVKHISQTQGDGVGYDIRSFTPEGQEKFIEVKTTIGNATNPFYITSCELAFAKSRIEQYYIYRVYELDVKLLRGKFFEINGDIEEWLRLDPILFKARMK
jgi:hypothetical protein